MQQRDEREHRFRDDIEGLRGIAVILVVAFHAGLPLMSGGFVGVDVFFVISGYLITRLLVREHHRTGTISVPSFIARRMRRLLPAAAVALVGTMVLAALVVPPVQMIQTAVATRAAAGYFSNLHFLRLASDYFSGDVRTNPTLHTWSLSVEEQFYLIWPWLLLALARFVGGGKLPRRRLAWGLSVVAAVSFAACCWYTPVHRSLVFYGTPFRAWEFACGGLASLIEFEPNAKGRWFALTREAALVGWVGLALVVGAAVSYSAVTDFPGSAALMPVAGTSLVLTAGSLQPWSRGGPFRLLGHGAARWIGRRSYSWYLWHWPFIVLGTALLPTAGIGARLAFGAAALALADLSFRFVETPARAAPATTSTTVGSASRTRLTIQLGLAATVVLLAGAELGRRWAISASNSPSQRAFTAAASDIPRAYTDGCVDTSNDERVHVCVYGVPSSSVTVALFGDSHAVQWLPSLDSIARARRWQLLLIGKTRCATAVVPVYDPDTRRESIPCQRWRSAAIDTIEARNVSLVVLANALVYVKGPRLDPVVPAVSRAEWRIGLEKTLRLFSAARIPTIVIEDTPLLDANVPRCLARSGWLRRASDACGTARVRAIDAGIVEIDQRAANGSGSHAIDLNDELCGRTLCPPMVGGIVAYSDNEHVSATMSLALAPRLEQALDATAVPRLGDAMPAEPAPASPRARPTRRAAGESWRESVHVR